MEPLLATGGKAPPVLLARQLPLLSFFLFMSAWLACWVISWRLNHWPIADANDAKLIGVSWRLPMISDCLRTEPEAAISRYLMPLSTQLTLVTVVAWRRWAVRAGGGVSHWQDGLDMAFGFATMVLGGVPLVINEADPLETGKNIWHISKVHSDSAMYYFFLFDIYMYRLAWRTLAFGRAARREVAAAGAGADLLKRAKTDKLKKSGLIKLCCAVGLSCCLGSSTYLAHADPAWGKREFGTALCEWLAMLCLQLFQLTFVFDFGALGLEELFAG